MKDAGCLQNLIVLCSLYKNYLGTFGRSAVTSARIFFSFHNTILWNHTVQSYNLSLRHSVYRLLCLYIFHWADKERSQSK